MTSTEPSSHHARPGTFDITIVIPAKNEENTIGPCLDAILSQETQYSIEIIVIDSGSTDRTLQILSQYPTVKCIRIPPEEFGHGKTRNLGAETASGKYIVFLNADALPVGKTWLQSLIQPLISTPPNSQNQIAGVYSRHLPKDGCHFYMARDILNSMPETHHVKQDIKTLDFMLFSTVSCVIPKKIHREFPFDSDIIIAEDQQWAQKVIHAGYSIYYQPQSIVTHSHNYTPRQYYDIKYKIGLANPLHLKVKSHLTIAIIGLILTIGGMIVKITGDIQFILFKSKQTFKSQGIEPSGRIPLTTKLKEITIAMKARIAGFWGKYRGWCYNSASNR